MAKSPPPPTSSSSSSSPPPPLNELTTWLNSLPPPFSNIKKKNNFAREFSDGVLVAELISTHFPKLVSLHSYVPANSATLKMHNWELLNRKVFPKLGIRLPNETLEGICGARVGVVEPVLLHLKKLISKRKMAEIEEKQDIPSPQLEEFPCLVEIMEGAAEYVVFRGGRFVPEELLREVEEREEVLKGRVRELGHKVHRLETLISLKESHLGDLTRQLHEMRVGEGGGGEGSGFGGF